MNSGFLKDFCNNFRHFGIYIVGAGVKGKGQIKSFYLTL